jgi:Mn2+/Fe2+ NRAMP family transporter
MGRTTRAQRRGTTNAELRYSAWDIVTGMVFSQVIAYFIQLSTAATLHQAGRQVQSASDAAEALRPLAGGAAEALFAVGLLATGALAIPVLAAGAAFALSAVWGWRAGLNESARRAKRFYGAIGAVFAIGLAMNFVGIDSFQSLFLASVIFGLLTPPLILVLLLMVNNRRIMGDRVAGRWLNVVGVVTLLTNTAGVVGFLLTLR